MNTQFGKYGPKEDYVGADCTLTYKGRKLIGRIRKVWRNETPSMWMADIYHFNGDPWPIFPVALSSLEILDRNRHP